MCVTPVHTHGLTALACAVRASVASDGKNLDFDRARMLAVNRLGMERAYALDAALLVVSLVDLNTYMTCMVKLEHDAGVIPTPPWFSADLHRDLYLVAGLYLYTVTMPSDLLPSKEALVATSRGKPSTELTNRQLELEEEAIFLVQHLEGEPKKSRHFYMLDDKVHAYDFSMDGRLLDHRPVLTLDAGELRTLTSGLQFHKDSDEAMRKAGYTK